VFGVNRVRCFNAVKVAAPAPHADVNLKPSDEFEFKPGEGKVLLLACGALGREIVDLIERNRLMCNKILMSIITFNDFSIISAQERGVMLYQVRFATSALLTETGD
jgi:hypothetical protein